jgi:hypothetical protein
MVTTDGPDVHDRFTRMALGISTALTIPLTVYVLLFAGLSQMQCDSCRGAEADRFYASHDRAIAVLLCGLAVTAVLLVVAWRLPATQRYQLARVTIAITAPLSPIVLFFGVFYAMVDWPR